MSHQIHGEASANACQGLFGRWKEIGKLQMKSSRHAKDDAEADAKC
jgi:hypothetical protein